MPIKSKIKKSISIIPPNKRKVYIGSNKEKNLLYNSYFKNNSISTTKYNLLTWIPKSLLFQFTKAANIYFLIISILTLFSFSPKNFISVGATFIIVLVFSLLKEGIEDFKRYNSDKIVNNKETFIYDYHSKSFKKSKWKDVKVGNIVKVLLNEEIPCDLLLIYSSNPNGISFVDTKSLDGETNLKLKKMIKEYCDKEEEEILMIEAKIICDEANKNLNSINGNLYIMNNHQFNKKNDMNFRNDNKQVSNKSIKLNKANSFKSNNDNMKIIMNNHIQKNNQLFIKIDNFLLKGSTIKNTAYILGYSIYTGHSTKIMKNSKRSRIKISNIMHTMNVLLYSLFIFLIIICILFSSLFIYYEKTNFQIQIYRSSYMSRSHDSVNIGSFLIKFLTFLIEYSHTIPMSLYVGLEVLKLIQMMLIYLDSSMYDTESLSNANPKTSDLIEELGQVDFIFTDKTGTLTKNEMVLVKCSINNIIYGDEDEEEDITEIEETKRKRTSSNKINLLNKENMLYERLLNTSHQENEKISMFINIISVCQSAYIEYSEKNIKTIQSSSPDEVALLYGIEKLGYIFSNRTPIGIEIEVNKHIKKWNILLEIPFDSIRKRMTVIAKDALNNSYSYIFSKGADIEMLNLMKLEKEYKDKINSHLIKFSNESLRTLVMGYKIITNEKAYEFISRYSDIEKMFDDNHITDDVDINSKEHKRKVLYNEIEEDLIYSGCSGIEDKLQDNVESTISNMIKANIRVWVLTGDKKETAIEIGRSCGLLKSYKGKEMKCIDLAITHETEESDKSRLLEHLDNYFYLFYDKKEDELIKKKKFASMNNRKQIDMEYDLYLIIDGKNLTYILSSDVMRRKFFRIGLLCKSVICCRVSPSQKAEVVKLAQENGKFITLSIGDGANDVPMLLTASIGIGIQGKEGTQAVRCSDYSIGQFQFLNKLLLVHGRLGYRRISYFIYYYFYKNIVLVVVELFYSFSTLFSGSLFYADFLPGVYNLFGTSLPAISAFSLDKDILDESMEKLTKLYQAGHKRYYFNMKSFWIWIFFCFIHGALVFYSGLLSLENSIGDDGLTIDHWYKSTICFCIIVHIATYKIFIELKHWNIITM